MCAAAAVAAALNADIARCARAASLALSLCLFGSFPLCNLCRLCCRILHFPRTRATTAVDNTQLERSHAQINQEAPAHTHYLKPAPHCQDHLRKLAAGTPKSKQPPLRATKMTNVKRPINLQLKPTRLSGGALSLGTPRAANNGAPNQQLFTATSGSSIITPNSLPATILPATCHSPKALSPTTPDSLPSQVMPYLFVGNQEQTNRETLNRLNIKYILSLGLLPIVSTSTQNHLGASNYSPTSPRQRHNNGAGNNSAKQQTQILMPVENSSTDFKIRIKSNSTPTSTAPTSPRADTTTTTTTTIQSSNTSNTSQSSGVGPLSRQTGGASTVKSSLLRDENKGVKAARSVYCKCINIADNSDQLISKFFDEAYAFIDEARRKRCNILIHCLAGISRSPTFAIAYLMRVKSLHWKDAYDLVKKSRPQIDPNLSFMGQLRTYNKTLREESKVDHNEIPAKSSIK